MPEKIGRSFVVQWHVTNRCQQRCRHCYIYGNGNENNGQGELDFEECLKILHDIHSTVTTDLDKGGFGKLLRINFSGGDPLLRKDFFELMREARELSIGIGILGNPHLITDEMAEKLHAFDLEAYQVSLDGLRSTHDAIREDGSFDKTISAIQTLNRHGVPAHVMTTIGRYNAIQLLDIVILCAENNVRLFGFDFFIPNSREDFDQLLTPQEARSLMYQYREVAQRLSRSHQTKFVEKNNLWTLLDRDLGIESELVTRSACRKICAGCSVGINSVSILPNGAVYPCRRLPIEIGKFPQQTLEEVFLGEAMDALRYEEKIERCGECDLLYVCRGCRAMAYAVKGSYFSPDPLCWKKSSASIK